jgi:hypothetical protein
VRHSVFPTTAREVCIVPQRGQMRTFSRIPKLRTVPSQQVHQQAPSEVFRLDHNHRVEYTVEVWICRLLVAGHWLAVKDTAAAAKVAHLPLTKATGGVLSWESWASVLGGACAECVVSHEASAWWMSAMLSAAVSAVYCLYKPDTHSLIPT